MNEARGAGIVKENQQQSQILISLPDPSLSLWGGTGDFKGEVEGLLYLPHKIDGHYLRAGNLNIISNAAQHSVSAFSSQESILDLTFWLESKVLCTYNIMMKSHNALFYCSRFGVKYWSLKNVSKQVSNIPATYDTKICFSCFLWFGLKNFLSMQLNALHQVHNKPFYAVHKVKFQTIVSLQLNGYFGN